MNFQFYLEKLKNSEEFKNFINENKGAYLCSGFFTIDKEGNDNKQHLDYCSDGKIFSFQLENNCKLVCVEQVGEEGFEIIDENIDFEFEEIERMIVEKMNKEKIKNKLQKILLSLQRFGKNDFFIGTVFISGLGIIKIKIDLGEMRIVDFERKSFFEMVNIVRKK